LLTKNNKIIKSIKSNKTILQVDNSKIKHSFGIDIKYSIVFSFAALTKITAFLLSPFTKKQ